MTNVLERERIVRKAGVCGGKACIAGHRIRVMDIVVRYEHMGMSADEIIIEFPSITLSDVHIALAYYYDHIEEIREDIRRNNEVAELLRTKYSSKLRERSVSGTD
jgi:uncharacterized protein (DUF433 family)